MLGIRITQGMKIIRFIIPRNPLYVLNCRDFPMYREYSQYRAYVGKILLNMLYSNIKKKTPNRDV